MQACLPTLEHLRLPEAELCRYAVAQACMQLGRTEGLPLFQALATNASPCVAEMAKSFADYEGLPFLLNIEAERSYSVEAATKDLTLSTMPDARMNLYLRLCPNSPTSEGFPIHLRLTAGKQLAASLDKTWTKGTDGRLSEINRVLASAPLGTFRGNGETLLSQNIKPHTAFTLRRDVTRVDDRHMHVKIFLQSTHSEEWLDLDLSGSGAKMNPGSVLPATGNIYNNENDLRFSFSANPTNGGPSLATGITIEANIELPEGTKCFYPQIYVSSTGTEKKVDIQQAQLRKASTACLAGSTISLSSTRKFKVATATECVNSSYTLKKLDAE